jgi:hypothetical protein
MLHYRTKAVGKSRKWKRSNKKPITAKIVDDRELRD